MPQHCFQDSIKSAGRCFAEPFNLHGYDSYYPNWRLSSKSTLCDCVYRSKGEGSWLAVAPLPLACTCRPELQSENNNNFASLFRRMADVHNQHDRLLTRLFFVWTRLARSASFALVACATRMHRGLYGKVVMTHVWWRNDTCWCSLSLLLTAQRCDTSL
jgi:hypothetical protein